MVLQQKYEGKEHSDLEDILKGKKQYLDLLETVDTDKNWERFLGKINESGSDKKTNKYFRIVSKNSYRIAAAIVVFLLTATTIYFAWIQTHLTIHEVSSLERNTEIELSDGSRVSLNKGSILSYNDHNSRGKREVKLKGEAFFNVSKNDALPFYVYLNQTTVKVLGTSFNINENSSGDVEISVLSGKVSFYESGQESKSILIQVGESAIFKSATKEFKTSQFSSQNFLFWKTGNLRFKNQNLKEVFSVLEDIFKVTIKVKDSQILNNKISSDCKGQQLEDILNELSILLNLTYTQDGQIIYIQME